MSNNVIIQDLSYLQDIIEETAVIGGNVYVNTGAITSVGNGSAVALAAALASGQISYTNALTQINKVVYFGGITMITANARATAYARTGNEVGLSSSYSTSIDITCNFNNVLKK